MALADTRSLTVSGRCWTRIGNMTQRNGVADGCSSPRGVSLGTKGRRGSVGRLRHQLSRTSPSMSVSVQEGTLARSLLSQAIDDADQDARHAVEIPYEIPRRSIARSKGSNGGWGPWRWMLIVYAYRTGGPARRDGHPLRDLREPPPQLPEVAQRPPDRS